MLHHVALVKSQIQPAHTYLEVAESVSRAESDMAGSGDHQHHEYVFLKKIERAL